MAAVTLALASDRYSDEAVLSGVDTNVASNDVATFAQIARFGDCLLLEAMIFVQEMTSGGSATGTFNWGTGIAVFDTASVTRDFAGAGEFFQSSNGAGALRAVCHIKPDQPVLWRQSESLWIPEPAIEASGTTSDWSFFFRVKRLRNTGAPS